MLSEPLRDNVSRTKASSPVGRTLFVVLRAADFFLQYKLLYGGLGIQLIEYLGGRAMPSSQVLAPLTATGLQPYYGLVTLFPLGSTIKQSVHMLFVSEQELSVGSGVTIPIFNTIFNTLNTLVSL